MIPRTLAAQLESLARRGGGRMADRARLETGMVSDELVDRLREALAAEPEVAAAYLYGSTVRGQATPLSDVDVAVVVTAGTEDRAALQRRLVTLLERRVQGRRAEVRFLDELPTAVRGRVVSEGVRVLTRDRALTVREEVRARMEYHDFLAFERAELATALRALRSGFAGG